MRPNKQSHDKGDSFGDEVYCTQYSRVSQEPFRMDRDTQRENPRLRGLAATR